MDLRGWLPLLIVAVVISAINFISVKRAKQKQDTENFVVCLKKGYASIVTFGLILFTCVSIVITINDIRAGGVRPIQDYMMMLSLLFMFSFLTRWFQFRKLRVKGDDFCFTPIFGRARKFTLMDIRKAEYIKDPNGRDSKVILRSREGRISSSYSFEQNYELLLARLQKEGMIQKTSKPGNVEANNL